MTVNTSPRFSRRLFLLAVCALVLLGSFYHLYNGSSLGRRDDHTRTTNRLKSGSRSWKEIFAAARRNPSNNEKPTALLRTEKHVEESDTVVGGYGEESSLTGKLSVAPTSFVRTQTVSPTTVTPPTTESNVLPVTYKPNVYGNVSSCSPNSYRAGLVELFTYWVKLAKKHRIEYVIFYGSLLGALRNGDIIPWDSDMDLLMDVKYWLQMESLASKRNFDNSDGKIRLVVQPEFMKPGPSTGRRRYTCQGKLTPSMVDQCSFQEPLGRLIKGGHHIDFYHFYDRGKRLQDDSEEYTRYYNKGDFFPFKKCWFMEIETTCPRNPWPPLQKYFRSTTIAESPYFCQNGKWLKRTA